MSSRAGTPEFFTQTVSMSKGIHKDLRGIPDKFIGVETFYNESLGFHDGKGQEVEKDTTEYNRFGEVVS